MTSRSRVLVLSLICAVVVAVVFALTRSSTPATSTATAPDSVRAIPEAPRALELASAVPDPTARAEIGAAPAPERAPAEPRRDLEVRGRLVGSDGVGVADIECLIESAYSMTAEGRAESMDGAPGPLARARSAADGAFVIALTPRANGRISAFQFACRASGYAVITRGEIVSPEQSTIDLGDLALLAGATITGLVRDVEGLAVQDSYVIATLSAGGKRWVGTGAHTKSEPDGSFRLEGVPSGWLRLTATATDSRASAPFELTVHPGEVREGLVLELPIYDDPLAISGVVYDVDGVPLSEAPLHWNAQTGRSGSSGSGRTRSDGRFRMQGSEGSVFRVTASHPRNEARAASRLDIPAGTHGIELRLTPLVTIPLRVRRPDGAYVPSFSYRVSVHMGYMEQVGLLLPSAPESPSETAIPVPSDPFVVEVVAAGYTTERTQKLAPDALPLSIYVVLRPLPVVRGRVVRGTEPVAGARVRAHRALGRGEAGTTDVFDHSVAPCDPCTEVTTDADGSFTLVVRAEGRWHARVASEGHPSVISDAVDVASGHSAAEILVDVAPRGTITGRVRDANGAALARVTVAASCGDGSPVMAVTDAEGAYRIEPLAPGKWQVRVLDPKRARMNQSSSSDGPEDAPPIAWDCRVEHGTVTTHDVVVSGP